MRKSAPTAKLFCRHHWTNSTRHSSLTTHNTLSSNEILLSSWLCEMRFGGGVSQLGRPVTKILGCRGQGIEDECARFKCEIVAGELRRKIRRGSAPASLADQKAHQRSEALRLHLLDTDGVPHSQESCTQRFCKIRSIWWFSFAKRGRDCNTTRTRAYALAGNSCFGSAEPASPHS